MARCFATTEAFYQANWNRFLQDNPELGVELERQHEGFLGSMVQVICETGCLTKTQREVTESLVLEIRKDRAARAVADIRKRLSNFADKAKAA